MARYTERDWELNVPPPFMMEEVTAWVSVTPIHWQEAQGWVDETLNQREPGRGDLGDRRYLAAPLAFVTFMEIGSMRSMDRAYAGWPAMREREVHVTLPVFEKRWPGFPNFLSPRFYPLALILDSSPAMIAGREVYGFPKVHGSIELGDDRLTASTEVFARCGDQATQRNQKVLEMKVAGDFTHEDIHSVPGVLHQMTRECLRGMERSQSVCGDWWSTCWGAGFGRDSLEIFASVFAGLTGPQPFVFLKQFRDHEVASRASYRAVTEASVEFSNLKEGKRLHGDWTLNVPDWESSRWFHRMGLRSGPVLSPVRVGFDFKLPLARTIWSSSSR